MPGNLGWGDTWDEEYDRKRRRQPVLTPGPVDTAPLNPAAPIAPPLDTPPAVATPAPTPTPVTPPVVGPDSFAQVPGFDLGKLQDPNKVNAKYTPDVRLFSRALQATKASPNEAGVKAVLDWMNANGGKVTNRGDTFSFNGGPDIDAVTNWGGPDSTWWFNNNPGEPSAQSGPGPAHGGFGGMGRGAMDYGPLSPGVQDLTGQTRGLIDQLLGGSPMNNDFLRELMGQRVGRPG